MRNFLPISGEQSSIQQRFLAMQMAVRAIVVVLSEKLPVQHHSLVLSLSPCLLNQAEVRDCLIASVRLLVLEEAVEPWLCLQLRQRSGSDFCSDQVSQK